MKGFKKMISGIGGRNQNLITEEEVDNLIEAGHHTNLQLTGNPGPYNSIQAKSHIA